MNNQCRENFNYKGFKFSLSFVKLHGLTASRLNYQWRNKYIRKTFTGDVNGEIARQFARDFVDAQNIGFDGLQDLSPEIIADIKSALEILPAGKSLTQIVKDSVRYYSQADIINIAKEFITNKESNGLSDDHITHCKGTLKAFCEKFTTFEQATHFEIIKYISKFNAPKTRINIAGILSNFFKFALRREAIKFNPFDKISPDDYGGNVKSDSIPEIATVQQATELIAYLQAYRPQFLKHFVLALFGGIRIAECERITDDLIDIARREISFPKKIVKGKIKAYIISDYPKVLFDWLAILSGANIQRPNNAMRTAIGKAIGLPANFARHSFATYHLSLYRDFHFTANLTRHLSISTLENNYVGSMVKKEVAKEFFNLTPNAIAEWSQNNEKRLVEVAESVKQYLYLARQKKTL